MSQTPQAGWGVQPTGPVEQTPQGGPPPQPEITNTDQTTGGLTQTSFIEPTSPEPERRVAQNPNLAAPYEGQQPTNPPVASTATTTPTVVEQPSILSLLRDFEKKTGCERYSSDSEKIKLLGTYLWLRQLTPSLPFETFLELFAPLADFDKENFKHPDDAIKHYLPRSKKAAEEQGMQQWSAKNVVDFVAVYVDMIRAAEQANVPVPATLNQFLTSDVLITQFNEGVFKEATPPKTKKGGKKKTKTVIRPTAEGQRCIYTGPQKRQFRGHITAIWLDEPTQQTYANFRSDEGQDFQGIGIVTLEITEDPPANTPENADGDKLPEIAAGKLLIPKAQYPQLLQALALEVPVGTVAIGDPLSQYAHTFPDGRVANIHIVNGEASDDTTRPYVDAFLTDNDPSHTVLDELRPREGTVVGSYTFTVAGEGTYTLEVTGNQ